MLRFERDYNTARWNTKRAEDRLRLNAYSADLAVSLKSAQGAAIREGQGSGGALPPSCYCALLCRWHPAAVLAGSA